jgi:uncharacterized damage-inducible protein DinB
MSENPHPAVLGAGGPLTTTPERAGLLASLDAQRAHVLEALSGLSDEALRRPVLPSGWSCLGLVQHLALDVERLWFRAVVGGEQVELASADEAWRVGPDTAGETVLDAYREEVRRADAIIAVTPLDAAPAWWPVEIFEGLPVRDMRRTILHVLTETACHAGHLDAVRALLDGRQRLVLT